MQLKPSLLLSTAAAVLISMPQAANAQIDFLTCVFGAIASGTISADLSDMAALTATLKPLCCKEGSDDPTCIALNCVDMETQTMVEPCTCGEAMGASAAMAADTQLALLIPPELFSGTNAIFEACCTSEETTATEVNTCLATLPAVTTTAATEPTSTVGATDAPVETTTVGATDAPVETTTAATEAAPTPTAAPSSGNIASVSFPMMIGYALINYVM